MQEESEGYDVYVNHPEPLDEGEEKHLISAFVADESGIINRVAGVFARRGVWHLLATRQSLNHDPGWHFYLNLLSAPS